MELIINGILTSSLYILASLGFTMLLRIGDILNLAYGGIMVGGMYSAIFLVNRAGWPYPLAVPVAAVAGLPLLWLFYVLVLRDAREEGHTSQIIVSVLFLGVLETGYQILFGADLQVLQINRATWRIFGVPVQQERGVSFLIAVLLCSALFAVFRLTTAGRAVEAAGKYREGAEVIGLPVKRIYGFVYALASAMALLAGALIAAGSPVSPYAGLDYLVVAVVISVAARLSFVGCVAVSLLYGVGYEILLSTTRSPGSATICTYAMLLCTIVIGARAGEAVDWRKLSTFSWRSAA